MGPFDRTRPHFLKSSLSKYVMLLLFVQPVAAGQLKAVEIAVRCNAPDIRVKSQPPLSQRGPNAGHYGSLYEAVASIRGSRPGIESIWKNMFVGQTDTFRMRSGAWGERNGISLFGVRVKAEGQLIDRYTRRIDRRRHLRFNGDCKVTALRPGLGTIRIRFALRDHEGRRTMVKRTIFIKILDPMEVEQDPIPDPRSRIRVRHGQRYGARVRASLEVALPNATAKLKENGSQLNGQAWLESDMIFGHQGQATASVEKTHSGPEHTVPVTDKWINNKAKLELKFVDTNGTSQKYEATVAFDDLEFDCVQCIHTCPDLPCLVDRICRNYVCVGGRALTSTVDPDC